MTTNRPLLIRLILCLCVLGHAAFAQSTEFTYQGRLLDSALPPTANYDFQFSLWDSLVNGTQVGTTQTLKGVSVSNGIFTVKLNFGPAFSGPPRFLQMAVSPAGSGSYTTLTPRQAITSSPYAIKSLASDTSTVAESTQSGSLFAAKRWDLLRRRQVRVGNSSSLRSPVSNGVYIWVAESSASLIHKIRARDMTIAESFPAPAPPQNMCFDGDNLWFIAGVTPSFSLYKMNSNDGTILGTVPLPGFSNSIIYDGSTLYLGISSSVLRVDANNNTVLGTTPTPSAVEAFAFDGETVFLTLGDGTINYITQFGILGSAPLTIAPAGGIGKRIAFDGRYLWVTDTGQFQDTISIVKYNGGFFSLIRSINIGIQSSDLTFDGDSMWVVTGGNFLRFRAADQALTTDYAEAVFNINTKILFDGTSIWGFHQISSNVNTTRLPPVR